MKDKRVENFNMQDIYRNIFRIKRLFQSGKFFGTGAFIFEKHHISNMTMPIRRDLIYLSNNQKSNRISALSANAGILFDACISAVSTAGDTSPRRMCRLPLPSAGKRVKIKDFLVSCESIYPRFPRRQYSNSPLGSAGRSALVHRRWHP